MRAFRWLFALGCVALVGLGSAHAAPANVILAVNTSTPSGVTFTSTGNAPSTGFFSSNSSVGIVLENFLTSDVNFFFGSVTGNLTPSGALSPYDRIIGGIVTLGTGTISLNNNLMEQQSFLTVLPALQGSATGDLSTFSALFPRAGAAGDITARDQVGQPTIIGQWQVVPVPLPTSLLLLATALAGLAGARRLRASAA